MPGQVVRSTVKRFADKSCSRLLYVAPYGFAQNKIFRNDKERFSMFYYKTMNRPIQRKRALT